MSNDVTKNTEEPNPPAKDPATPGAFLKKLGRDLKGFLSATRKKIEEGVKKVRPDAVETARREFETMVQGRAEALARDGESIGSAAKDLSKKVLKRLKQLGTDVSAFLKQVGTKVREGTDKLTPPAVKDFGRRVGDDFSRLVNSTLKVIEDDQAALEGKLVLCPACGESLEGREAFCPRCGAPLAQDPAATK